VCVYFIVRHCKQRRVRHLSRRRRSRAGRGGLVAIVCLKLRSDLHRNRPRNGIERRAKSFDSVNVFVLVSERDVYTVSLRIRLPVYSQTNAKRFRKNFIPQKKKNDAYT